MASKTRAAAKSVAIEDKETMKSHARQLDILEKTRNDLCNRLLDSGSRSLVVRIRRARNVDAKVKTAVITELRAAAEQAFDECEAAINAPDDAPVATKRVSLRSM